MPLISSSPILPRRPQGRAPVFNSKPILRTMRLGRWWHLPLLASIAFMFACEDEPPLRQRGEFVDYHAEPSLEICAGTVAGIDHFVQNLAFNGKIDLKPSNRFRYFYVGGLDGDGLEHSEVRHECGRDAGGCYRPWTQTIYAPDPFLAHEVAHATEHLAIGDRKSKFLSEAFAGALDPTAATIEAWNLSAGEVRAGILRKDRVDHDVLNDELGTTFMAYVLMTRGLAQYWNFITELRNQPGLDAATIDRVVMGVYGESLESIISEHYIDFKKNGNIEQRYVHAPLGYCGPFTPTYTLGAERLVLPRLESCADPLAQGTVDQDDLLHVETAWIIQVPILTDDPVFVESKPETWPARLIYDQTSNPEAYRGYDVWSCDRYARGLRESQLKAANGFVIKPLRPGANVVRMSGSGAAGVVLPEAGFIERTSHSQIELLSRGEVK